MQNISITTYTQTDAITLAQAKAHLNILDDSFDTLIGDYITAAHVFLYQETSILVDGAAKGYFKKFEDFYIPLGVIDTVAVYYYDSSETRQTLSTSNYRLIEGKFCDVELVTEPTSLSDREYPYEVEVTTTANTNPMVTQALRMIVADFFETRQSNEVGAIKKVSRATQWQLDLISLRTSV